MSIDSDEGRRVEARLAAAVQGYEQRYRLDPPPAYATFVDCPAEFQLLTVTGARTTVNGHYLYPALVEWIEPSTGSYRSGAHGAGNGDAWLWDESGTLNISGGPYLGRPVWMNPADGVRVYQYISTVVATPTTTTGVGTVYKNQCDNGTLNRYVSSLQIVAGVIVQSPWVLDAKLCIPCGCSIGVSPDCCPNGRANCMQVSFPGVTSTQGGLVDSFGQTQYCHDCEKLQQTIRIPNQGQNCFWYTTGLACVSGGYPDNGYGAYPCTYNCPACGMYVSVIAPYSQGDTTGKIFVNVGHNCHNPSNPYVQYSLYMPTWDCKSGPITLPQTFNNDTVCNNWPASVTISPCPASLPVRTNLTKANALNSQTLTTPMFVVDAGQTLVAVVGTRLVSGAQVTPTVTFGGVSLSLSQQIGDGVSIAAYVFKTTAASGAGTLFITHAPGDLYDIMVSVSEVSVVAGTADVLKTANATSTPIDSGVSALTATATEYAAAASFSLLPAGYVPPPGAPGTPQNGFLSGQYVFALGSGNRMLLLRDDYQILQSRLTLDAVVTGLPSTTVWVMNLVTYQ